MHWHRKYRVREKVAANFSLITVPICNPGTTAKRKGREANATSHVPSRVVLAQQG